VRSVFRRTAQHLRFFRARSSRIVAFGAGRLRYAPVLTGSLILSVVVAHVSL
jgi:hypothetical protein